VLLQRDFEEKRLTKIIIRKGSNKIWGVHQLKRISKIWQDLDIIFRWPLFFIFFHISASWVKRRLLTENYLSQCVIYVNAIFYHIFSPCMSQGKICYGVSEPNSFSHRQLIIHIGVPRLIHGSHSKFGRKLD
jgi:hypothetical protein